MSEEKRTIEGPQRTPSVSRFARDISPHPPRGGEKGRIAGVGTLPPRPREGHKGTFGTVAVIGGSCGGETVMAGAR